MECVDALVTLRDIYNTVEQLQTVVHSYLIWFFSDINNKWSKVRDSERVASGDHTIEHMLHYLYLLPNTQKSFSEDGSIQ
jgi:hypothetical protein